MTKKKRLKHLILTMVAILFISVPSTVLANTHDNLNTSVIEIDGKKETIKTKKDNKKVRIVESIDENGKKSIATFDKINNTMLIETEGEKEVFLDLSEAMNMKGNIETGETSIGIMSTPTVISEYTYSDYEYEITMSNPKAWKIFRPQESFGSRYYKNATQNSGNVTYLENFKKSVDQVNDLELTAFALVGAGLFFSVLVIIATGGIATSAAFAAAGVVVTDIPVLISLDRACNDALYWYLQV